MREHTRDRLIELRPYAILLSCEIDKLHNLTQLVRTRFNKVDPAVTKPVNLAGMRADALALTI